MATNQPWKVWEVQLDITYAALFDQLRARLWPLFDKELEATVGWNDAEDNLRADDDASSRYKDDVQHNYRLARDAARRNVSTFLLDSLEASFKNNPVSVTVNSSDYPKYMHAFVRWLVPKLTNAYDVFSLSEETKNLMYYYTLGERPTEETRRMRDVKLNDLLRYIEAAKQYGLKPYEPSSGDIAILFSPYFPDTTIRDCLHIIWRADRVYSQVDVGNILAEIDQKERAAAQQQTEQERQAALATEDAIDVIKRMQAKRAKAVKLTRDNPDAPWEVQLDSIYAALYEQLRTKLWPLFDKHFEARVKWTEAENYPEIDRAATENKYRIQDLAVEANNAALRGIDEAVHTECRASYTTSGVGSSLDGSRYSKYLAAFGRWLAPKLVNAHEVFTLSDAAKELTYFYYQYEQPSDYEKEVGVLNIIEDNLLSDIENATKIGHDPYESSQYDVVPSDLIMQSVIRYLKIIWRADQVYQHSDIFEDIEQRDRAAAQRQAEQERQSALAAEDAIDVMKRMQAKRAKASKLTRENPSLDDADDADSDDYDADDADESYKAARYERVYRLLMSDLARRFKNAELLSVYKEIEFQLVGLPLEDKYGLVRFMGDKLDHAYDTINHSDKSKLLHSTNMRGVPAKKGERFDPAEIEIIAKEAKLYGYGNDSGNKYLKWFDYTSITAAVATCTRILWSANKIQDALPEIEAEKQARLREQQAQQAEQERQSALATEDANDVMRRMQAKRAKAVKLTNQ